MERVFQVVEREYPMMVQAGIINRDGTIVYDLDELSDYRESMTDRYGTVALFHAIALHQEKIQELEKRLRAIETSEGESHGESFPGG